MNRGRLTTRGFTLAEVLTALVVVAVLAAVAVPLWHAHLLRVRRVDATQALLAVQAQQDAYFGRNAHYADAAQLTQATPGGLGLANRSKHGYYDIVLVRDADGLGYLVTARAAPTVGQDGDSRCVEFSLDHNGQRRAQDSEGKDRSADCWH